MNNKVANTSLADLRGRNERPLLSLEMPTFRRLGKHLKIRWNRAPRMKAPPPPSVAPGMPRAIKPAARAQSAGARSPLYLRFGIRDQIMFTKRLGMILRAGMPIMEGLHMLQEQSSGRSSAYICKSLIADVSNGQTLSTGLEKFERIFGAFSINIIRIGETSGTLHENLDYLADELKKKHTLRRKIIGAMVYPALIVCATVGITVMLTVYIFPKIIPIFQSVKAELPISTKILIAVSGFLGAWGVWLVGGIVVAFIALTLLMRNEIIHTFFDAILLRIPIFGQLSRDYNLTNISRTMGILLRSDVRIVSAMDLVAGSTKNLVYRRELLRARERLIKGQKISQQFRANKRLFPGIFAQMITVGESTGNLSSSFNYLSDMYDEEINELIKNLTSLLEPVLMIVMGLIVGFIAISIITPIYSITQNLTPK